MTKQEKYPLIPPITITDTETLKQLVESLRHTSLIGMDIESNGLFAYHEKVCLIQMSTFEHDYLIDPFTIADMSPLGELTANPQIEFVFHASEYDIGSLKRDFGFEFGKIFDTLMAVRILGQKRVGLADVVENYFGVHIDKKYQKANWQKRPLSAEEKHYAQMDTHFLPALHDILYKELKANNALEEAQEIFDRFRQTGIIKYEFDADAYWNIPAVRLLKPRQIACLRELYLWREKEADKQNVPRYKIMQDKDLVRIAKHRPRNIGELHNLIPKKLVERYGKAVMNAVKRGAIAEFPTRPKRIVQDRPTRKRYEKLKVWRKKRADQRGVESDIIIPGDVLWAIAKIAPKTLEELQASGELGNFRLAAYGTEILKILNGD